MVWEFRWEPVVFSFEPEGRREGLEVLGVEVLGVGVLDLSGFLGWKP